MQFGTTTRSVDQMEIAPSRRAAELMNQTIGQCVKYRL